MFASLDPKLIYYKTLLLKYPWSDESENIAECEKYHETDEDIHHPSFCFLRILFALTSPCPEYPSTCYRHDSEKHGDIDNPPRNLTKNILKSSESFTDSTYIFTCFWVSTLAFQRHTTPYIFRIRIIYGTRAFCSWYFFSCHDIGCGSIDPTTTWIAWC